MELPIRVDLSAVADVDAERELVERAKWDREAFAALYRRYYPVMARYVRRRVGDPHATDDLVAEVFLTALRYLPKYRQRGVPVRAWFYRIATNAVNTWVRRRRRSPLRSDNWQGLAGVAARENPDADSPARRARRALLSLSPKYQAVLALHYLERMNVEEVAQAVGCRVGTVKSRLSRGREALRDKLQKRR